tara:strand:+ start:202 stop:615 length:414 start_codon:yes stop_codon:yes gene_type:complete
MFFKKGKSSDNIEDLVKVAALLIHSAKIDENYSDKEEAIIKKTLLELGSPKENLEKLLENAKKVESNSVQILDFTKEVKNMDNVDKIKIIETLWRIIYSNKDADIYETNLMRRLEGLLYIDSNVMGAIKDKIKNENK